MLLLEILDDIDRRCPNVFEQADKIAWLNTVQENIYRDVSIRNILNVITIIGTANYDISTYGVNFGLIKSVFVDDIEYKYKEAADQKTNNIYFKVQDDNAIQKIGIYPTPTVAGMLKICYDKVPTTLTVDDLDTVPDIRKDMQEILKYGVMVIIAEAREEIEKSNNFTIKYNALLKHLQLNKYSNSPSYPKYKDVHTRAGNKISGVIL